MRAFERGETTASDCHPQPGARRIQQVVADRALVAGIDATLDADGLDEIRRKPKASGAALAVERIVDDAILDALQVSDATAPIVLSSSRLSG